MKIGLQVSSLKKFLETPQDVLETFKKINQIGYNYIQTEWIGEGVSYQSIRDSLNRTGLLCVGTQDFYTEVLAQPDKYIARNELWESKYMGITIIPPSLKDSKPEHFKDFASMLNDLSRKINESGKILALHPLFSSYEKTNHTSALDEVWQFLDDSIQLQPDFYHVVRAKEDPVEIIKKFKGRMDQTHFKDFRIATKNVDSISSAGFDILKQGDFPLMPIGQGIIQWEEIIQACISCGVKYCFVEQEAWDKDPFECMQDSFSYLVGRGVEV